MSTQRTASSFEYGPTGELRVGSSRFVLESTVVNNPKNIKTENNGDNCL